jgi:hypothetical protein
LLEILRELTLSDGGKLVAFIRAQDWSDVDADVRLTCLHQINARITGMREASGLAPIDDGFAPHTTAFQIVKQIIGDQKQPPD